MALRKKKTAGSVRTSEPARRGFSLRRGAGRAGAAKVGSSKASSKATSSKATSSKATRAQKRAARRERLSQLRTAFTTTRKADNRLVPLLAAAFLVPFVILLVLGLVFGHPYSFGFFGAMLGVLAALALFGRRAQRNAYSQVEGQVGAAAAVLGNMRGDWRVTPAVGYNREQDMVHRVLGRPGVVLVAEGSSARARALIIVEKKKLARFVGDVPVYEIVVGDGDGQVPLRGLEKHFVKLPRNVAPKDVNVLDRKLKAMSATLPIPKGPMPTSARQARGKMR